MFSTRPSFLNIVCTMFNILYDSLLHLVDEG
jgi:hypothetical protein